MVAKAGTSGELTSDDGCGGRTAKGERAAMLLRSLHLLSMAVISMSALSSMSASHAKVAGFADGLLLLSLSS